MHPIFSLENLKRRENSEDLRVENESKIKVVPAL
jgi:hypothetical protein